MLPNVVKLFYKCNRLHGKALIGESEEPVFVHFEGKWSQYHRGFVPASLLSWLVLGWIALTAAHAATPCTGSQAAAYGCKIADLFLSLAKTVSFEPISL